MDTKINHNVPIYYQDATALAKMIRKKEVSPVEVVQAHLDRIEKYDSSINAIVTISQTAMTAAKAAEKAVMRVEKLGLLHGVPFTVKDSIAAGNQPIKISHKILLRFSFCST